MPALFVRLAGCNLQCPLCDTDYTSERLTVKPLDALEMIFAKNHSPHIRLVVFTGGEPFRQNLAPLVRILREYQFLVQIETNGSLWVEDFPWDDATIVCSPKTAVNERLAQQVHSWKYVLRAGQVDPRDGLPTSALGMPTPPGRPLANTPRERIYVQPCDEQDSELNQRNLEATLQSCLQFGYRLCLQQHKIVGLP